MVYLKCQKNTDKILQRFCKNCSVQKSTILRYNKKIDICVLAIGHSYILYDIYTISILYVYLYIHNYKSFIVSRHYNMLVG